MDRPWLIIVDDGRTLQSLVQNYPEQITGAVRDGEPYDL